MWWFGCNIPGNKTTGRICDELTFRHCICIGTLLFRWQRMEFMEKDRWSFSEEKQWAKVNPKLNDWVIHYTTDYLPDWGEDPWRIIENLNYLLWKARIHIHRSPKRIQFIWPFELKTLSLQSICGLKLIFILTRLSSIHTKRDLEAYWIVIY